MMLFPVLAPLLLHAKSPAQQTTDLGSPRIEVRAKARVELRALGRSAIPSLEKVAHDPDPEIAASSRDLLKDIRIDLIREEATALIQSGRRKQAQGNLDG